MYQRKNPFFNVVEEILDLVDNEAVLMRVDLNATLDDNLQVVDFEKFFVIRDTTNSLADAGARLVLMSHLGRPAGKDTNYSMRPFTTILERVLGRPVIFIEDCIGEERDKKIQSLKPGEIALLENLRFHKGEKENSQEFAEKLTNGFNFYVNEAFASSHGKDASIDGAAIIIGSRGMSCVGYNFQKEHFNLSRLTNNPQTPFIAITGGKKVSDKIQLLKSLIVGKPSTILIGGAMANAFILALGYEIGKSYVEKDSTIAANDVLELAILHKKRIVLPLDVAVLDENGAIEFRDFCSIRKYDTACDVGPKTIREFKKEIRGAKTIFWNGNLGITGDVINKFYKGTNGLAGHLARFYGVNVVIGGGDTSAAIPKQARDRIISNDGYISTCGGAILKFIADDGNLPGIAAQQTTRF